MQMIGILICIILLKLDPRGLCLHAQTDTLFLLYHGRYVYTKKQKYVSASYPQTAVTLKKWIPFLDKRKTKCIIAMVLTM